jgi:hypothetical protein
MKFSEMDGREVARFSWIEPESGAFEFPHQISSHPLYGERAKLSHEYYGSHAENWIVVYVGDKEIRRYNTKYIDAIIWTEEVSKE